MIYSFVMLLMMGLGAFLLCAVLIAGLLPLMRRCNAIDIPNERSSHTCPVPRGGGWAMGITLIISIAILAVWVGPWQHFVWLGIGFILLMVVSACDDIQAVSAKLRVFIQLVAVICGLDALAFDYSDNQIFLPLWGNVLPMWLNDAILILSWMWFINLFNFMDGLDGQAGTGAVTICITVMALVLLSGLVQPQIMFLAAATVGTVIAFLLWNWHPAKLFMGDTGSVPLGYLIGFLLISLAQAGLLFAAFIPALYFVADTTITLVRRVAQGKKFWHAHREFYFHQAQRKLLAHDEVVKRMLLCHAVLFFCALLAMKIEAWALVPAVFAVAILCRHYYRLGRSA